LALALINQAVSAIPFDIFGKRQEPSPTPTSSLASPPGSNVTTSTGTSTPTPTGSPAPTTYTYNNTLFPYPFTGTKPNSTVLTGNYTRTCTLNNTWALTFDDGPALGTSALLDALDVIGVKVTFFVNGLNFNCIYQPEVAAILKRAYDSGHQVASHTWSHEDLTTLSKEEIIRQAYDLEDAFRDIIGAAPRYLRPPYGNYNETVTAILRELNYVVVGWDIDTEDALLGNTTTVDELVAHVENQYKTHTPGPHISLAHETVNSTSYITGPWAATYVKSIGYQLLTVGGCLGDDPRNWYKDIGPPRGYAPGRVCQH